jgi:hypothetical protein
MEHDLDDDDAPANAVAQPIEDENMEFSSTLDPKAQLFRQKSSNDALAEN